VEAVATVLAAFGKLVRAAIERADKAGDKDTSDLFTEISRGIDKWLWFVEAHVQGGSVTSPPAPAPGVSLRRAARPALPRGCEAAPRVLMAGTRAPRRRGGSIRSGAQQQMGARRAWTSKRGLPRSLKMARGAKTAD
jgi:hypothetical protein